MSNYKKERPQAPSIEEHQRDYYESIFHNRQQSRFNKDINMSVMSGLPRARIMMRYLDKPRVMYLMEKLSKQLQNGDSRWIGSFQSVIDLIHKTPEEAGIKIEHPRIHKTEDQNSPTGSLVDPPKNPNHPGAFKMHKADEGLFSNNDRLRGAWNRFINSDNEEDFLTRGQIFSTMFNSHTGKPGNSGYNSQLTDILRHVGNISGIEPVDLMRNHNSNISKGDKNPLLTTLKGVSLRMYGRGTNMDGSAHNNVRLADSIRQTQEIPLSESDRAAAEENAKKPFIKPDKG